ncbi:hypothetical protein HHI36_009382 [Cryptolaemus montrouzieri]|uniref:Uncharacterized protein n=1 Tax=Cryptolaemus montrouzieri TaxID=559131 RepID=A0ABD2MVZ3_9CUCU
MLVHLGILFCVVVAKASPLPEKYSEVGPTRVLYDQKQQGGGWNVQAEFKDFLFLIIPDVKRNSSTSSSSLEQSLLYLLSKSANSKRRQHQHIHPEKSEEKASSDEEETDHFIESKTAPYQVDISKNSGGLLSRLYPEKPKDEGILVAKSPTIALLKDTVGGRIAKALVLAIPDEDIIITKTDKKGLKKKAREEFRKKNGERLECEPGQVKDSYGNCKILKY